MDLRADLAAPLGRDDVLIDRELAGRAGLRPGDRMALLFGTGERTATVAGTFERGAFGFDYLISPDSFAHSFPGAAPSLIYAGLTDGAGVRAVRAALALYPTVQVLDRAELRAELSAQVDTAVTALYGLLGLTLVIALLGIANTVNLSVLERGRELGLLRAAGATSRQVRALVRWEAVLISTLGAFTGLAVAVAVGWATVRSLSLSGFGVFELPAWELTVVAAVAAAAGSLAAIPPARRAGRTPMLVALGGE